MTDNDLSGPAFPCKDVYESFMTANGTSTIGEVSGTGVTKRDYFAAAALTGLCANSKCFLGHDDLAQAAYRIAAAMMRARDSYA